MSVCRAGKRGGDVAALFKDVYQCKQIKFGKYPSFENLGIVLKGASRILLIIIYRPPKSSPAFDCLTEFDCFAIPGDFNIHIRAARYW